ncbi:MAG: hypothetical protein VB140_04425 [Burkholderia sp.]
MPRQCARTYHKKGESKARYRVRNWAAYNEGLINRGNGRCCINRV